MQLYVIQLVAGHVFRFFCYWSYHNPTSPHYRYYQKRRNVQFLSPFKSQRSCFCFLTYVNCFLIWITATSYISLVLLSLSFSLLVCSHLDRLFIAYHKKEIITLPKLEKRKRRLIFTLNFTGEDELSSLIYICSNMLNYILISQLSHVLSYTGKSFLQYILDNK